MLSVRAIYDGRKFNFLEPVKIQSPREVIVTFLDDADTDVTAAELHYLASKGGAFDFLDNSEEDIYSDKDLKLKYKK